MSETAEVVIIGAGVVGASVAYHLAEAGCTDVLMIERGARQGLGSTGRATGGVRAQFSTEVNVRMSLYSIEFLSRFKEATGRACGYEPNGYLFLATSKRHLELLEAGRTIQRAAGLKNAVSVTAEEIREMVPQLRTDDVLGGAFCQTDGYVEPLEIMRGFTEAALRRGARLQLDTSVEGIEVEGRAVTGVRTTRGRIETRAVVNAAGAWAAEVARTAGVELPVVPLRRQLVGTGPFDGLPERTPMVIDLSDGFHFRRYRTWQGAAPGVRLAWPDEGETPGFKEDFDPSFAARIVERASRRVPTLSGARVVPEQCRAGLYEMTPDRHAIIGQSRAVRGLYFANGFSGHGVMHSPATGRAISDLILRGRSSEVEVAELAPERFEEGRLIEETPLL